MNEEWEKEQEEEEELDEEYMDELRKQQEREDILKHSYGICVNEWIDCRYMKELDGVKYCMTDTDCLSKREM